MADPTEREAIKQALQVQKERHRKIIEQASSEERRATLHTIGEHPDFLEPVLFRPAVGFESAVPDWTASRTLDPADLSEVIKEAHLKVLKLSRPPRAARPEGLLPNIAVDPYQAQALGRMLQWDQYGGEIAGGILADEMGLGKTLQAIMLILATLPHPDVKNRTTIIVTPAAVLSNWKSEIQKFTGTRLKVYVMHKAFDGKPIDTKHVELRRYDVVLCSMNALSAEFKSLEGPGPIDDPDRVLPNCPLIGSISKWFRVIVDEVHHPANNNTSTSFRATMSLIAKTDKFLGLTGTAFRNSIMNIWSYMAFLRIPVWSNRENFETAFCRPKSESDVSVYNSTRYQQLSLGLCLKPFVLRRLQKHCLRLNACTHISIDVVMAEDEIKTYDHLVETALAEFGMNTLKLHTLQRQCVCHPYLNVPEIDEVPEDAVAPEAVLEQNTARPAPSIHDVRQRKQAILSQLDSQWKSSSRIESAMDLYRAYHEEHHDRRTIIFADWTTLLAIMKKRLEMEGLDDRKIFVLDGTIRATSKHKVVQDFAKSPYGSVLLAIKKAGGEGMDLTSASHVIFLHCSWTRAQEDQNIKRVQRRGQPHDVLVHYLQCKIGIEEAISQKWTTKQIHARNIIDCVIEDDAGVWQPMQEEGVDEIASLFGDSGGSSHGNQQDADPTATVLGVSSTRASSDGFAHALRVLGSHGIIAGNATLDVESSG
ncbi:hypothetical protein B0A49_02294 [Cryomyces minteri]|uniref:Helicase ATP-binding domain-containing protein n=1 Tax=Cryomyces minteri TaxID=331657 RepID=A0A4U0XLT9_9PEZI|nr:hypothetical protein B0A49_02294 [Cryomyces minteri]